MKTIRTEAARLWYALKIAAGTGPVSPAAPDAVKAQQPQNERGRSPALVVISRAGRSTAHAQRQQALRVDGKRPAYALPYSPDPVARRATVATPVDGDAGIVV